MCIKSRRVPPSIFIMLAQVHLVHSIDCTAKDAADARQDLVPPNAFQEILDAEMRQWTVSGMK